MKVIGLTGSIAMGKSEVAKVFAGHNIPVFDADAEVHKLYDSREGAELLRPFVPQAVLEDRVDRPALSRVALADRSLLEQLEKRVHGRIAAKRQDFLAAARAQGHGLVLLDIPLLFETGADNTMDSVIVVTAPADLQRQRALARPGMTAERLAAILERQMPDAEKRRRATYIIENDGSLESLRQKVATLISQLDK